MLRKIDCVMIRVNDIKAAAAYYAKVFGLQPQWRADDSIGLVFPESDAEIVLHCDLNIPSSVEVHYLVENVIAAVANYAAQGCRVLVEPFDIAIGKCAVIVGSHMVITFAADLEDQGIGMCKSIPCRNICTERVLPEEKSLRSSRMLDRYQPLSNRDTACYAIIVT